MPPPCPPLPHREALCRRWASSTAHTYSTRRTVIRESRRASGVLPVIAQLACAAVTSSPPDFNALR